MSVRLDHGDESLSELHEINVTPFIDVILVLLIIFMIAAPLATVDISVDLPTANAERTFLAELHKGSVQMALARWQAMFDLVCSLVGQAAEMLLGTRGTKA